MKKAAVVTQNRNGGPRPNSGRKPGVLGKVKSTTLQFTPDVLNFIRDASIDGVVSKSKVADGAIRSSAAFKRWQSRKLENNSTAN